MLNAFAKDWLKKRGISPETAERFGVTSARRRTGEWLAFPVIRDGKTVNTKYRRIDEKGFAQEKGGEKWLWNGDALSEPEYTGPIVLTEGEMDALAAIEAGFERVASLPDGAPAEQVGDRDSAKYSYVDGLVDVLRGFTEIVLATDGDGPGQNLLHDLAPRLGKARCRYVRYRDGAKDLNDVLLQGGPEAVRGAVSRAAWYKITGLCRFDELPPPPKLTLWRAGLSGDFDKHVAICPSQFSVWTGIPGHGKSALLKAVSMNLSRKQGVKACVASFEDDIAGDYQRDIAKYLCGKPFTHLSDDDWAKTRQFLNEQMVFINPDWDDEPTVEWMLEKMEAAVVRYGARLFIIDPWTELDHQYGDLNETQYVAQSIAAFKRFAKRFDVHVALVAHPTKLLPDKNGALPIPNGYNVSGSAHWANKADLGVTVHRSTDDIGRSYSLVRVWKSKRHDIMGPPGDVKLEFDLATGRFSHFFEREEADA